jgi:hypothetical protein
VVTICTTRFNKEKSLFCDNGMYLCVLYDSHNTRDYFADRNWPTDCCHRDGICLQHGRNLIVKFRLHSAFKRVTNTPITNTPIPDREKQKNEYNGNEGVHSDRLFIQDTVLAFRQNTHDLTAHSSVLNVTSVSPQVTVHRCLYYLNYL